MPELAVHDQELIASGVEQHSLSTITQLQSLTSGAEESWNLEGMKEGDQIGHMKTSAFASVSNSVSRISVRRPL